MFKNLIVSSIVVLALQGCYYSNTKVDNRNLKPEQDITRQTHDAAKDIGNHVPQF